MNPDALFELSSVWVVSPVVLAASSIGSAAALEVDAASWVSSARVAVDDSLVDSIAATIVSYDDGEPIVSHVAVTSNLVVTAGNMHLAASHLTQGVTTLIAVSSAPLLDRGALAQLPSGFSLSGSIVGGGPPAFHCSAVEARVAAGAVTLHAVMEATTKGTTSMGSLAVDASSVALAGVYLRPTDADSTALTTAGTTIVAITSSEMQGPGRCMELSGDAATVVVANTTFSHHEVLGGGGGAVVWARDGAVTLQLRHVSMTSNMVLLGKGGAVLVEAGDEGEHAAHVELNDVTFSKNQAQGGGGGAVAIERGTLTAAHVTCVDNEGFGGGGCLHVSDGVATVSDSVIKANVDTLGGGVFALRSQLGVWRTRIMSNVAFNGANVHSRTSSVTLVDCSVEDAEGYEATCAKVYDESTFVANRTTFRGCVSTRDGGALGLYTQSTARLSECSITECESTAASGAAIAVGESELVLVDTMVSNNKVASGSVVKVADKSSLSLVRSVISGNRVAWDGEDGVVPTYPSGLWCEQSSLASDEASVVSANWPYNMACNDCNADGASSHALLGVVDCGAQAAGLATSLPSQTLFPTPGGSTEVPFSPALSVDDLSGLPVAVYVEGVASLGELSSSSSASITVPAGIGALLSLQVFVEGQHSDDSASQVRWRGVRCDVKAAKHMLSC